MLAAVRSACVFAVLACMRSMTMSRIGAVSRFLVIVALVVLCCLCVVTRSVRVVFRSFAMMISCFLGQDRSRTLMVILRGKTGDLGNVPDLLCCRLLRSQLVALERALG
jgi:hypothetical protein